MISQRYWTLPPRIPRASYRHASPSGPWPWVDLVEDVDDREQPNNSPTLDANEWGKYPNNLFPNWNYTRVTRSGLAKIINPTDGQGTQPRECNIHHIDIDTEGCFSESRQNIVTEGNKQMFWEMMQHERPSQNRVRALFVENMTGPVLQMLGTRYNIEPFFFTSSLNWIPARYQEDVQQNQGDHITVTLNFLRTVDLNNIPEHSEGVAGQTLVRGATQVATIDTQAPLPLRQLNRVLMIDLLAIHMIRKPKNSTVISYHPPLEWRGTTAKNLHARMRYAGQSVYWQKIFKKSNDPTFVLLSILWYAVYAWDESLENLYTHICNLETRVLKTNDIHLTRELHIIRASLLHYASLLEDFRKTVLFVQTTTNPAMQTHLGVRESAELMDRESNTLISEIERLEMSRKMQDMRLENVMNLAFASVNFEDSRGMQRLTEAALRDSAAMKQISYLTMIFLPASFVATAFGMNINELVDLSGTKGTLPHYLAVAIPLTTVTIWIMMALHNKSHQDGRLDSSFWNSLQWPIYTIKYFIRSHVKRPKVNDDVV